MNDTGLLDTETNGYTGTPAYDYGYSYNDRNFFPTPSCYHVDLMDFGSVFLPTLYSLVFIVGFLGNSLVVCVLVKNRNYTTLTDICLFNLALSDLVFLLTLPFYAHYSRVRHWAFGDFLCRFISTCHRTGFFSSIFFMVAMTLERYLVIMHAHKVASFRTVRVAVVLSVSIWLLSLCISLPAFIFTKVVYDDHSYCMEDMENTALRFYDICVTNILGLAIPLLVMVVCYSRIIPTLLNMRSAKRHRAVKLIITIVAVFFFLWVPFNICNLLTFLQTTGILPKECNFNAKLNLSLVLTETFAYTHCCLNPIIYAFVGQKFMKRALQLLGKWDLGIRRHLSRDLSGVSRSTDVTPSVII